jgi:tetratricopeptide (TPR) repeat protein
MRTVAISILLAAGAMLASTANAQAPAAPTPEGPPASSYAVPNDTGSAQYTPPSAASYNFWDSATGYYGAVRDRDGVEALEAGNYARAEEIFSLLLSSPQSSSPAIRFYLGVAEMNLGKWDEAKKDLMVATRRLRTLPDPKSRLGVTYAKLGDIESANAQRAALVKMSDACKGTCRNSQFIVEGIQMIDEALAQPPAVKPES